MKIRSAGTVAITAFLSQLALAHPVLISPEDWKSGDEIELPSADGSVKKYRIARKLGEGAMGLSFQAEEFPYAVYESEPQKLRTIKVGNPRVTQEVNLDELISGREKAFARIFKRGVQPSDRMYRHLHFQFTAGRYSFWEDGKAIVVPIQVSDYIEHALSDPLPGTGGKIERFFQVHDLLSNRQSEEPGLLGRLKSLLTGKPGSASVPYVPALEDLLDVKTNLILLYGHHQIQGLAPLHHADYLHLDLKPSNVLMRGDLYDFIEGKKVEFALTDFDGLFDLRKSIGTQSVLTTPIFAAPEAHRLQRHLFGVNLRANPDIGQELTGATDLYQVGANLYYLLFGYTPLTDPEILDWLTEVVSERKGGRVPTMTGILDVLSTDSALHKEFRNRVAKKLNWLERALFQGNQIVNPDLLRRYRAIKHVILGCLQWDPRERIRFFRSPPRAVIKETGGEGLIIIKDSKVTQSGLGRFLLEISPETLWLKKTSDEKAPRKSERLPSAQCLGDALRTEILRVPR